MTRPRILPPSRVGNLLWVVFWSIAGCIGVMTVAVEGWRLLALLELRILLGAAVATILIASFALGCIFGAHRHGSGGGDEG
jgi:hypothetical protein